jgi:hypothetical protein
MTDSYVNKEYVVRLEAERDALRARDEVWREKKRVLESDLGKAWEDNKRLREAIEWACAEMNKGNRSVRDWHLTVDELRRRVKEG